MQLLIPLWRCCCCCWDSSSPGLVWPRQALLPVGMEALFQAGLAQFGLVTRILVWGCVSREAGAEFACWIRTGSGAERGEGPQSPKLLEVSPPAASPIGLCGGEDGRSLLGVSL